MLSAAKRIASFLVVSLLSGSLGYYLAVIRGGELYSKREWSYVQAASEGSIGRGDQGRIAYFLKDGFEVIGIQSASSTSHVWLLAAANAEQRIKILPAQTADIGQLRITSKELSEVEAKVKLIGSIKGGRPYAVPCHGRACPDHPMCLELRG